MAFLKTDYSLVGVYWSAAKKEAISRKLGCIMAKGNRFGSHQRMSRERKLGVGIYAQIDSEVYYYFEGC